MLIQELLSEAARKDSFTATAAKKKAIEIATGLGVSFTDADGKQAKAAVIQALKDGRSDGRMDDIKRGGNLTDYFRDFAKEKGVDFDDKDGKALLKALRACYTAGVNWYKNEEVKEEALTEAKTEYEGSNEWDDDASETYAALKKAKKIVESAAWKKHMQDTKKNYGVNTNSENAKLISSIDAAIKCVDDIYEAFEEAV